MASPAQYGYPGEQQPAPTGGAYVQPQQSAVPLVTVQVQPQPVQQAFPPQPVQTTCPNCRQVVITVTQPMMGLLAWLVVGGLIVIGCCILSCIPCFVNELKDVRHVCPSCNMELGRNERLKL